MPESGNARCLGIYTLYHTWKLLNVDIREIPGELTVPAPDILPEAKGPSLPDCVQGKAGVQEGVKAA